MERRNKRNNRHNMVELKELVYAPLHAVSEANMRLSSNIVDFLASTGDMNADSAGNPTVHLHTIQMQYQQLRNDADDNTVAERIGLEIPLLSIYPLSSLKVSKTKVAFDVEVKNFVTVGDSVKIFTQVCSKKQRESANQARFSFEVELESVPISEGLARFVDTLNAQAVPKRLSARPLDESGKALTGKELEEYNRRMELIEREKELNSKIEEIKEVIRGKNNLLNAKTGMNYEEYIENRNYTDEEPEDEETADLCKSIKEYKEISLDLEVQLDELEKEKITQDFQSEPESGSGHDSPQPVRNQPSNGRERK
ncbi:MAG: DUF2589 domain-containing protein [Chitinispirillales bacterium]|jgi:hypothetical protein|nr:DUF2589 domain-containing protein [Chitinispirillales bacterium]